MQPKFRIAAYGVVWDDEGRILLARGSAEAVYPGWWLLPGGGVEHGEHPRDAVVREFAEETGLTVEVGKPLDTMSAIATDGVHNNAVIFNVRVTGGELYSETDEATDYCAWVRPDDIKDQEMTPFVATVLGFGTPEPEQHYKKTEQHPRPTPPRRAKRDRKTHV